MTLKKKILIVSTNADLAGAPIHVETVIRQLMLDFEILAIFGEEGPIKERLTDLGVKTIMIPTLRSSISPIRDLKCLISFIKQIRLFKPDLIHAHSSKAGMIARISSLITKVPCVYTVHGWGFGPGRSKFQSIVVFIIEWFLVRFPRCSLIFVSEADQKLGIEMLKLSSQNLTLIPNGIRDHQQKAEPLINSSIIMVARVCHAKNHEMLFKAIEKIDSELKIQLLGEGTMDNAFKAKLSELSPSKYENFDCLGTRSNIPDYLSQSGIFILCSRYEGLPISIIEAMCAGLPIIATNVGGTGELVEDGVNGYLIEKDDIDALVNAIRTLSNSSTLRQQMGNSSREKYLENYGEVKMIRSIVSVYNKNWEVK